MRPLLASCPTAVTRNDDDDIDIIHIITRYYIFTKCFVLKFLFHVDELNDFLGNYFIEAK